MNCIRKVSNFTRLRLVKITNLTRAINSQIALQTMLLHILISRLSAYGCLKFKGQKKGVGVYTEKPFVRITHIHTDHRIIKNGGGRLHGDGRLLGRIRYLGIMTT